MFEIFFLLGSSSQTRVWASVTVLPPLHLCEDDKGKEGSGFLAHVCTYEPQKYKPFRALNYYRKRVNRGEKKKISIHPHNLLPHPPPIYFMTAIGQVPLPFPFPPIRIFRFATTEPANFPHPITLINTNPSYSLFFFLSLSFLSLSNFFHKPHFSKREIQKCGMGGCFTSHLGGVE